MLGYRLFEQPSYVSGHDPPVYDSEVEFVYDKDSDPKEKQFPELEYIANYRRDAEEQNIRRLLEVVGEYQPVDREGMLSIDWNKR